MAILTNTPFDDIFGIEREQKIAKSGIRNVFTPHQPISEVDLLFGRKPEVQKLVETLNTPGQHVLLYGERGVGKSSLANVVSTLLRHVVDSRLFVKRCDQSDTFESIMMAPLADVGADLTLVQVDQQRQSKTGLNIKIANGERAKGVVATYEAHHSLNPSTVVEAIADLKALLVVDEADAIGNPEDRKKLAEAMKLLSDSSSQFKIMVVGIAATGSELTAAHPSVQRCLRETKLERMSETELRDIVDIGGKKTGLTFSSKVTKSIVQLSAGYPHFTHLIALKCAEAAVAEGRRNVDDSHLEEALADAVKDAEATLKREYDDAVRSFGSSLYEDIVLAAGSLKSEEFNAATLRQAISERIGELISQGSLNNYLKRLVSDDGSTIMQRAGKGVYRFSDPRMASFTRMVGAIQR